MQPLIIADQISKSYGGVHALTRASLSVAPGTIHALVGENGAGKSTLIKILGNRVLPDSGHIKTFPEDLKIGTVFQELTLFPHMTVAENLLIGQEPRYWNGLIDRKMMLKKAEETLSQLGIFHIDPYALVSDISLSERQIIEISRVITKKSDLFLLDEPTSALGEHEVEWLLAHIRTLKENGASVVFTSHRWAEIKSIADRLTIYRNGTDVGSFDDITEDDAISLMTGQKMEALYPVRALPQKSEPVLTLTKAQGVGTKQLDLELHAGEILGIGGLAGHGHRELFFSLFGAPGFSEGVVKIDNKALKISSPRAAMQAGIAFVPEDRKSEGLFLPLSVRDNFSIAILDKLSKFGFIRSSLEKTLIASEIDRLSVKTPSAMQFVGALSGGNQQKVLLGRWLLTKAKILLLYDVTRGVDVGVKHEIFNLVASLASQGYSILFYSSDAEELVHLCHRVKVMRHGKFVATLEVEDLSAEAIVSAAMRDLDEELVHAV